MGLELRVKENSLPAEGLPIEDRQGNRERA